MNDTNDLRSAISGAVMFGSTRHPLDRVLADPKYRADLLDAMGLDAREGWLNAPYAGIYSVSCGTEPMPEGKYLVVRPRGDTDKD